MAQIIIEIGFRKPERATFKNQQLERLHFVNKGVPDGHTPHK